MGQWELAKAGIPGSNQRLETTQVMKQATMNAQGAEKTELGSIQKIMHFYYQRNYFCQHIRTSHTRFGISKLHLPSWYFTTSLWGILIMMS